MDTNKALKIFGLKSDVTLEELKKEYRVQVKLYHPDKFSVTSLQKEGSDRMKEINLAYTYLQKFISSRLPKKESKLKKTGKQNKNSDDNISVLMKTVFEEIANGFRHIFEKPNKKPDKKTESVKKSDSINTVPIKKRKIKKIRCFNEVFMDAVNSGGNPSMTGPKKINKKVSNKYKGYKKYHIGLSLNRRRKTSREMGPVSKITPISRVRRI
ncbi:MAG: hypothetical protein B6I31_04990 [Desulfobacteraceae bacterium 4572_19]|nr:MAG: hypothetical protein B6I31_04990 [Desulfobacteraceae bacterium 4572_19]